jgi:hypothetical protein
LKRRTEIYRVLVKRGAPYAGKKTDYLEYRHKMALDPKRNEILRMRRDAIVDEIITVIRMSYKDKGFPDAPPAVESRIRDEALDQALNSIGASKGGWEK